MWTFFCVIGFALLRSKLYYLCCKIAHAGSRTRVTSIGGLYGTATLPALSPGIDICVRCAVFLNVVRAVVVWVWFAVRVFVYSVVCFLRMRESAKLKVGSASPSGGVFIACHSCFGGRSCQPALETNARTPQNAQVCKGMRRQLYK